MGHLIMTRELLCELIQKHTGPRISLTPEHVSSLNEVVVTVTVRIPNGETMKVKMNLPLATLSPETILDAMYLRHVEAAELVDEVVSVTFYDSDGEEIAQCETPEKEERSNTGNKVAALV